MRTAPKGYMTACDAAFAVSTVCLRCGELLVCTPVAVHCAYVCVCGVVAASALQSANGRLPPLCPAQPVHHHHALLASPWRVFQRLGA